MFKSKKMPQLEIYQMDCIDKEYNDLLIRFNNFKDEKKYDKNIILFINRMEHVIDWEYKMIYNNHLTKQDSFAQYKLKEQLTRSYSCLLGNIEEIFLQLSIELTKREKEIIDDLIKIRSLYLSDKEKMWLHEKMKEINGDER